eukprot:CAMPEP_0204220112 /NCGR_PEP_ID=MMETSP0361-20130328/80754_1 /ASSEMBLY_ACC=CAM_ASM_000343 /TAXON_ID=268821 /ORGANISM="Scrippsiella Hangoei, Strain SHTV-5" /LENGTH=57 /DNA_ID=CAMNT_0051185479 /DNA_START=257 /DNA_END=428 /DNA_ORIENTATION=+
MVSQRTATCSSLDFQKALPATHRQQLHLHHIGAKIGASIGASIASDAAVAGAVGTPA